MLAVLMLNRMRVKRQNLRKQKFKTFNNSRSDAVQEYCRTCLGHEDLVSIFYNRETSKKRTKDLKLISGVEIKMNDGLSQKICTNCIETMNQALQFRLQSAKNDIKLRKNMLRNEDDKRRNQKTNYLEDYGYIAMKDQINKCDAYNEMDSVQSEEACYLSIGDEFKTDHDYLLPNVSKRQPARRLSGDRPGKVYICAECGKQYGRRASYRAHVNKHYNYCICEECGRRCRGGAALAAHRRARHGAARAHKCRVCEYTSATKAGLDIHVRRHTGERPYECEHCGAAFHSRGGLIQHLPIHLTESNFECPICHKREKSKRLLQHHHHKVHKRKRHRDIQHEVRSVEIPLPETEESTVVQEFEIENYV